jgi:hypothetical protein
MLKGKKMKKIINVLSQLFDDILKNNIHLIFSTNNNEIVDIVNSFCVLIPINDWKERLLKEIDRIFNIFGDDLQKTPKKIPPLYFFKSLYVLISWTENYRKEMKDVEKENDVLLCLFNTLDGSSKDIVEMKYWCCISFVILNKNNSVNPKFIVIQKFLNDWKNGVYKNLNIEEINFKIFEQFNLLSE